MDIVYSFDGGYSKYAGISLFSLLENNKHVDIINIYIVYDNVCDLTIDLFISLASSFNRKIYFINIDKILPRFDFSLGFGKSAYARLFLAEHISSNKVYYFDSDTIVCGSIAHLDNISIDGYAVAGVQDTVNPYYLSKIGMSSSDAYINSGGVIVLNLLLWRQESLSKFACDFINLHNGCPPHNDQGTLNYISKGRIKLLPVKYNVMPPIFLFRQNQIEKLIRNGYYDQLEIDDAINCPVVIHYTAEFFNRPWFSNCSHPLKNIFIEYKDLSPFELEIHEKPLSLNCKIQNFIQSWFPFFVYRIMHLYIEIKHIIFTKS